VSDNPPRICLVNHSHITDLIRIGEASKLSPWSAQSYLDEIKNPNAILLRLVSCENEIIGFVVGRLVPGGEIDVRMDAEIYNIAVVSEHRNTGNGQRLLDEFLQISSERGAKNIWLEVRESNFPAIAFYRKNGFEQVQRRPNFYEDPRESALLMRLDLTTQKGLLI
jgi:ribosomal-protein-alanine N-acetyltransferase